jgi:hypothetical protein
MGLIYGMDDTFNTVNYSIFVDPSVIEGGTCHPLPFFLFLADLILFMETEGCHSHPYVAAAAHTHLWPLWGRASSEGESVVGRAPTVHVIDILSQCPHLLRQKKKERKKKKKMSMKKKKKI